jgi:DNA mismatch repair protein MutL
MFIDILPPEVRGKIAAGEVIESPTDVVKELVENSLDAKATELDIEIFGGGKRYIRVKDNGMGIHPEDIDMAVLEGATSKLRSEKDLYSILSYGFRGEALYAISSVSRTLIRSRYFQEDRGYELLVEGGKLSHKRAVGMPPGTSVEVRDLFFNLPVRKKFLRKSDTERRSIRRLITLYALANPGVSFRLISEGKRKIELKAEELSSRVESIYGTGFERLEYGEEPVDIEAFVKRNAERSEILLFINSRPIFNRSYKDFLKRLLGYRTIGIVFVRMPPYLLEQNIHPKKREVRVLRERKFLELLREALTGRRAGFELAYLLSQEEPTYGDRFEVVGQLADTFIIALLDEYVYFFDQHLLSERVNYEKLHKGDPEGSCRNAIKKGRKLSKEEMEGMIREWLTLENPHVCPHGRPIYYRIPFAEIMSKVDR